MSPQTLSGFTGSKQTQPNLKTLLKISEVFPRVNVEWLVTGKGDALRPLTGADNAVTSDVTVGYGHGNAIGYGNKTEVRVSNLDDCQKELQHWMERARVFEELAEERKTVIELLKKGQ